MILDLGEMPRSRDMYNFFNGLGRVKTQHHRAECLMIGPTAPLDFSPDSVEWGGVEPPRRLSRGLHG